MQNFYQIKNFCLSVPNFMTDYFIDSDVADHHIMLDFSQKIPERNKFRGGNFYFNSWFQKIQSVVSALIVFVPLIRQYFVVEGCDTAGLYTCNQETEREIVNCQERMPLSIQCLLSPNNLYLYNTTCYLHSLLLVCVCA